MKSIASLLVTCLTTPDMAEFTRRNGRRVLNLARALDKLPVGNMVTLGKR